MAKISISAFQNEIFISCEKVQGWWQCGMDLTAKREKLLQYCIIALFLTFAPKKPFALLTLGKKTYKDNDENSLFYMSCVFPNDSPFVSYASEKASPHCNLQLAKQDDL